MDNKNRRMVKYINEGERKKISINYVANILENEVNYYVTLQRLAMLDNNEEASEEFSEKSKKIIDLNIYMEHIKDATTFTEISSIIGRLIEEIEKI